MNSEQSFTLNTPLDARVLTVPKSATLAINEMSKQLIQEGRDVTRLGLGQSPFPVPDTMVEALQPHAGCKDYMAVQGYLPLREEIAAFINRSEGLNRSAGDVIVGPGSKELFFGLQMVLDCDLVLPAPSWVSYAPQAALLGKKVHWLACTAEDGWKLSASTLDAHCRHHTGRAQLLILNSPNNPSGACFTESELQQLAAVAREHGVIVLSDEIYSQLHYQGQHMSIARYYPEGTIISNGISKWAGAGGWRLGFFSFPAHLNAVLQSMITVASETFTSVSAPIQMASISAFDDSPAMQRYVEACRNIMRVTGTVFSTRLRDFGIANVPPQGGFYNLGDFNSFAEPLARQGITSAPLLCKRMLDVTGVAALPGTDFGLSQGLYTRFAFVDFDGHSLLHRVLADDSAQVDDSAVELEKIFSAANKIGDWLNSL